jgi:hypothetical protein
MFITRFAKVATVLTVLMSVSAVPAFAEKREGVRVAPLPALGTGLPGLIVLAGGLVAFARRRR